MLGPRRHHTRTRSTHGAASTRRFTCGSYESGPEAGILLAAHRLRASIRSDPPAAIFADGVKAALIAVLAGTGVPVLWRKVDFSRDGRITHFVARRCWGIWAVSRSIRDALPADVRARTRVVYNGLPTLDVRPAVGKRRMRSLLGGGDKQGRIVGLFGRIHPEKGQLDLVNASPAILRMIPDARIALVGPCDPTTPDYERVVRARVDELGLQESVFLIESQRSAPELIAGCDVIVTPSREGFGLAAAEGLSAGTPVVAYDVGGTPEVLGGCGLLVPFRDVEALGAAIGAICSDEGLRSRLSGCGLRRSQRFRLSTATAAYLADLREAAESRRA